MNRIATLIQVLLLAVVGVADVVGAGQERANAIVEMQSLGGKVTIDEKSRNKPVVGVDLSGTRATDRSLAQVTGVFPDLQSLNLERTQVTDSGRNVSAT